MTIVLYTIFIPGFILTDTHEISDERPKSYYEQDVLYKINLWGFCNLETKYIQPKVYLAVFMK